MKSILFLVILSVSVLTLISLSIVGWGAIGIVVFFLILYFGNRMSDFPGDNELE